MNNKMSYADIFQEAMNETKKEIDKYFDQKVKEFEAKTTPKAYVPYVDTYPEEMYSGFSSPHLYYMQHVVDLKWDQILFSRKLMEYKICWVFNGRKFFDQEYTKPVSEGWEFYAYSSEPEYHLTHFHETKAKELKLTFKQYGYKYL